MFVIAFLLVKNQFVIWMNGWRAYTVLKIQKIKHIFSKRKEGTDLALS